MRKIATFTADRGCGGSGSIFFPLENFSAQTKSCGAGCRIEPGANAGGGPARLRIHVAQREDVAMKHSDFTPSPQPFELDFDDLLHPAQAFAHPRDVVADADLTVNEKRAVLASWASDACAVEAAPALRHAPGASAGASGISANSRELLARSHAEARQKIDLFTFRIALTPWFSRRGMANVSHKSVRWQSDGVWVRSMSSIPQQRRRTRKR